MMALRWGRPRRRPVGVGVVVMEGAAADLGEGFGVADRSVAVVAAGVELGIHGVEGGEHDLAALLVEGAVGLDPPGEG